MNIMTRDEVMQLQDRELDVAVATWVMGWTVVDVNPEKDGIPWLRYSETSNWMETSLTFETWQPSKSITDAWRVLKKTINEHLGVFTEIAYMHYPFPHSTPEEHLEAGLDLWVHSDTAPTAICRVALLFVFHLV